MVTGSVIHWFRKGLRLHDNPALLAAVERAAKDGLLVRPVYILDPWFVKNARVGPNRWRFLQQSLVDLDNRLRGLGSRLYVVRGSPEEQLETLLKEWKAVALTWEEDTEPYATKRDARVSALCKRLGVEVLAKLGHTLYSPDQLVAKNKGQTPLTYQKFIGLAASLGAPPKPSPAPSSLPKLGKEEEGQHMVPSLHELGVDEKSLGQCLHPGGETAALERMDIKVCMTRAKWVRNFEKPKTSPNSLEPSTTVLSPHLKFGTLSCRELYWRLDSIYRGQSHTQPPVSLHGQLLWREFFYCVGANTPNFDKMVGNSVCRQIPWDANSEKLAAWAEARTGLPWIDAIMTQLRTEGWIHHLARHSVACFLTRGDLWQSWEEGMKVFEELLLDADWSLNAGNWMWLSASAFFHQYFRVYSPIAFGKKTDSSGAYIRKYLPKLAKFPDKFIYEPWTAPLAIQKAAGCVIGTDYPRPMVDHAVVSKENMGKMKAAYDRDKGGDVKRKESPAKKETGGSAKKQKKLDFVKK